MSLKSNQFQRPRKWGEERHAGFEFEFSGIGLDECAAILTGLFGGSVDWKHSYLAEIGGTRVGTIKLCLDYELLQKAADAVENEYSDKLAPMVESTLKKATDAAGSLVQGVVPVEVSTAPLLFEDFPRLEEMREALKKAKAKGTKERLLNAFGMHINPETPDCEAETLLYFLKAFILLYPWLKKELKTDLTRRFLSFIDAYPTRYQKIVTANDYNPSLEQLMNDYLVHNPTRNRPLDMLPLFAHIDEGIVANLSEKEQQLIKPRPTFHYRLPNCNIDLEEWRVAHEWNGWFLVEELAADPEKTDRLCTMYQTYLESPMSVVRNKWPSIIGEELKLS